MMARTLVEACVSSTIDLGCCIWIGGCVGGVKTTSHMVLLSLAGLASRAIASDNIEGTTKGNIDRPTFDKSILDGFAPYHCLLKSWVCPRD